MTHFDDEQLENSENSENIEKSDIESAKEESVNTGDSYGMSYTPDAEGGYRVTEYTPSSAFASPASPADKKTGGWKVAVAAVAILLCILLSGVAGFTGTYIADRYFIGADAQTTAPDAPPAVSENNNGIFVSVPSGDDPAPPTIVMRGELMSYAEAAAKVKDSVVEITTEATVNGGYYQQYVSEGAGSGVIITADGYIVTNNHVIDGAEKITVRLTDGTEYPATLVGTDSRTDVGVIKIDPAGRTLTVAAFIEDSKKLVVGEEVLAIGNPLGELGGTVTNGIISALERAVKISGSGTMTLLQTNAAVNPGNSGGGLFNLYGELIGVVNAKSAGADIEGLGFAIPANTVRDIATQLMQHGYVKGRPTLNATTLDLDSLSAYYYFRSAQAGVYVVESNIAELKNGDRVISVGGTEIERSDDITDIVEKHEIGEKIEIVVVRERSTVTVSVTLTEYVPKTSK